MLAASISSGPSPIEPVLPSFQPPASAPWTKCRPLEIREKQICKIEEDKRLKSTVLCVFCLAGTGVPHGRQGREEKEKAGLILLFLAWSATREPTWEDAPPVTGARGKTRHRCATITEAAQNSPALFPELFCNFQMLLCIFGHCCVLIYLFFFLCCKHVIMGESA